MGTISTLSVSLTANTRGLTKGLNKARAKVKGFAKSIMSTKGAIVGALGVGGIGAAISSGMDAFRKQEQSIASLDAANQSMKRSVGLTEQLKRLAADIQREGIIGDESIIQGQAFLSTFSQIPDSLMPRATRAMVDLMAKTGRSGDAAANMIGKAAMGLSGALRIAGITLSESTEKAIKAENKLKKAAEAAGISIADQTREAEIFKMILSDIEAQIGGTNAALARTDTGAFDQLSNSAGDLREKLGEVVAKGLAPFARQLSIDIDNSVINVESLSQSVQNFIFKLAEGAAFVARAWSGIKLVFKSIQLAIQGVFTAVVGIISTIMDKVGSFGRIFGVEDINQGAIKEFSNFYDSQVQNIRDLKAEISQIAGDLADKKTGGGIIDAVDNFAKRAKATEEALKKPVVLKPEGPTGSLDKLIINPGKANQRVIIDKSPQLDRTNQLLESIANRPGWVAIAG